MADYKWQLFASQAADALKNGQFGQALAMYNQLIEKDPRQALYHEIRGSAHCRLHLHRAAGIGTRRHAVQRCGFLVNQCPARSTDADALPLVGWL